jgi:hypothetical protein
MSLQLSDPILLTSLAFAAALVSSLFCLKSLKLSSTMFLTCMVLPPVVCAALLAINGSLGTGIAIMGIFGLVRYRSLPGTGTDIVAVFYSMVTGLMMSTGYWVSAFVLTIVIGLILVLASFVAGRRPKTCQLRIFVPESLTDFEQFTVLLKHYAHNVKLDRVRSAHMGSMMELVYSLEPDPNQTGKLLEEVRTRNSNLNVILTSNWDQAQL